MAEVYIVDAARSPVGKFLGSLSGIDATHLGAEVVKAELDRTHVNADEIDEVIVGNVISAGLGQNVAKQVVRYAGLPDKIPAYAVNKVCASSLKAVGLAAEAISCGNSDVIIAGGIESMSNAPFSISGARQIQKFGNIKLDAFLEKLNQGKSEASDFELVDEMLSEGLMDCYSNLHMGTIAETLGGKYGITREDEDRFALQSHQRAAQATDSGKFKREIIPMELPDGYILQADEGIRRDTSIEKLSALKPAFKSDGMITAGNASQLSDGASFLILVSEKKLKDYGLEPLAKIESFAASGGDPEMYGIAPVAAVNKSLAKANLKLSDVDLIEINEAFCVQALAVVKELGIDESRLNVNGGATAIGHPLGASGACILSTLVYALKDRGKEIGLATLCHGGGGAASIIVRRT
ncbi:MAG: thiolase family protein [Candidatus Micrarchaeota archaeon]|nr:thiolase family protein [Candidatus Micrarchaeota archaeon]